MIKKYTIYDQLEGVNKEASSFEEAIAIQNTLINAYVETLRPLFAINVMVQNDDQSWTQYAYDENGDPIIPDRMPESIPTSILGEGPV